MSSPNLNFPRGGWDEPDAAAWNAATDSNRRLIRYWLNNCLDPEFFFVSGFTEILFALHSESGANVNDRRVARQHHIATVSSEGDLYVDDNVLAVDESLAKTDLTIFGTSLLDLLDSPEWRKLDDAVAAVPAECGDCLWLRSCGGGQLFNRFTSDSAYQRKSALCDTIMAFHEEVAAYLVAHKMNTVDDIAARLGREPSETAPRALASLRTKPSATEPANGGVACEEAI